MERAILSVRDQCALLCCNRSSFYYAPVECAGDTELLNEISEVWHEIPVYGYRRLWAALRRKGHEINQKRVQRLMREAGLMAIYQRPKTSILNPEHKVYPYLLRGLPIVSPNQVWATDLTYIKMSKGFMYLMAIMDVYSRKVLTWDLGNSMDLSFCLGILERALRQAKPGIMNTDQGSQYTSLQWINMVEGAGGQVSMDGIGRWADNIPIERFWRTIKWEHLFLRGFETPRDVKNSLTEFIEFYNTRRLHQALNYNTPDEIYGGHASGPTTILGVKKAS